MEGHREGPSLFCGFLLEFTFPEEWFSSRWPQRSPEAFPLRCRVSSSTAEFWCRRVFEEVWLNCPSPVRVPRQQLTLLRTMSEPDQAGVCTSSGSSAHESLGGVYMLLLLSGSSISLWIKPQYMSLCGSESSFYWCKCARSAQKASQNIRRQMHCSALIVK